MGKRKRSRKQRVQATAEAARPDTEVSDRPTRRVFTKEYKQQILDEADAIKDKPGAIGALLRREGLYSSHLSKWRETREQGARAGLAPQRRGPKVNQERRTAREVERLEREVARLKTELAKAQAIIDVQKKLSEILGITLPKVDEIGRSE
jgi:transposase